LTGKPTLSTPFQLIISRRIYDDMIAQARSELPNECCGILAGTVHDSSSRVGEVSHRYPLVNAAASVVEYLSDPKSMFEAVRDMRQRQIDILAIYHSHPGSDPVPSRIDLERNYSPEVVNLIISLKGGVARVCGWWLEGNSCREADWRLSD
jgi:proteasome lid subunit RPN8/RPN11